MGKEDNYAMSVLGEGIANKGILQVLPTGVCAEIFCGDDYHNQLKLLQVALKNTVRSLGVPAVMDGLICLRRDVEQGKVPGMSMVNGEIVCQEGKYQLVVFLGFGITAMSDPNNNQTTVPTSI